MSFIPTASHFEENVVRFEQQHALEEHYTSVLALLDRASRKGLRTVDYSLRWYPSDNDATLVEFIASRFTPSNGFTVERTMAHDERMSFGVYPMMECGCLVGDAPCRPVIRVSFSVSNQTQ